ncbi:hypothetical protein M378DRAFT_182253 [Amanita muscaria Koide BX008]|uniref:Uncharacterized protein n=1 Tax=Amanita muscaria (strain Koide BX008) TaxID=946122 RepID=A0A0C2W2N5_AMAMK|nr:hypothetical protein M378DRAFT_182253 [Amanita muscaria Koide BX008]
MWEHTPKQDEYLQGLYPSFIQARKDKRIEPFKNKLFDGWFKCWPEEKEIFGQDWEKGNFATEEDLRELSFAIEKRKQQLYNHIRWHSNGKVIQSRTSGTLKKFFKKEKKAAKQSRKNHKLELYSQHYYETRFKNQVDKEVLDTTPPNEQKKDYNKRKMTIYRRWRSLAWEMESSEVKAEIDALWNEKNSNDEDDNQNLDQDEHEAEVTGSFQG